MVLDKFGSIFEDRRKNNRRKKNVPVETDRRKCNERRKENINKKK